MERAEGMEVAFALKTRWYIILVMPHHHRGSDAGATVRPRRRCCLLEPTQQSGEMNLFRYEAFLLSHSGFAVLRWAEEARVEPVES